jgi:hypothetical protein
MGAFGEQVSLVLDSMPTKPDIYIEMVGAYTSSDSSLAVDVKLTALSAMPAGKYNLSVFVTESEIIEAQESRDNSGVVTTIADYEHNHVFRGAMNGTWGFEFTNGAISSGQVFTKAYSGVKIGKDWKPAHLHLVALVYHADGPNENQVIQVEQIDL